MPPKHVVPADQGTNSITVISLQGNKLIGSTFHLLDWSKCSFVYLTTISLLVIISVIRSITIKKEIFLRQTEPLL